MPIHKKLPRRVVQLTATVALATALAMPSAAQDKKDDGEPGLNKEITRIAEERAARIRDLLTMIAIGSRRDTAISFGLVEASADGEVVRIHNVVAAERRAPVLQVVRMIELRDFDRQHFIPRHLRISGDASILASTLPPQVQGIFQRLRLPHLRFFTSVEYRYDETKGTLSLKTASVEWLGQVRITVSAELENFPPLNQMMEAGVLGRSIEGRMKEVRFKSLKLTLTGRNLHTWAYAAFGTFSGATPAQAKQQLLGMLDQRQAKAKNKLEADLAGALKVMASGPGQLVVSISGKPTISFKQLEGVRSPEDAQKVLNIVVKAKNEKAEKLLPGKLPDAWQKLPTSDSTDPDAHECDRYAAAPGDSAKKVDGVPDKAVDRQMALAACRRATLEYPKAARFQFQFGRALLLSRIVPEARKWLARANEGGYAAAKALLAKAK